MAVQLIDLGDGLDSDTGDTVYDAFAKINSNYQELYTFLGDGVRLGDGANVTFNSIESNVIYNNGNLTTRNIWNYGNVRINYDVFANGYYWANGEPVFGNISFSNGSLVAESLVLGAGTISYDGNLLINGVPVGGVSDLTYNSGTGNLTLLSSDGSEYNVDIGVGRSDDPTFSSLTIDNTTSLNGGLYVNGNLVLDSNGNLTTTALLPDSGVVAGTYGNASAVPVVTVDSKGLITTITSTPVAGVDNLVYDPVSSNLTLSTSAGTEFTVSLASSSGLADEIARATDAEANLQSQIDSLGNIDAIMQQVDETLQSQIYDLVNVDAITSSITSNLQSQINDLVDVDAITANVDASISANLAIETSRALAAESSLQTAINLEHQHHVDGDATLQTAIDAEITRATAAESNLQTAINLEHQHHVDGDATLQTAIDAETTRAQTAESNLSNSITSLSGSLTFESDRAQLVEANLQSQIDSLGNIDAIMQQVDTALQNQINDLVDVDAITANIDANLQSQIANLNALSNLTYDGVTGNLTVFGTGTEFSVDLGVGTTDSPTFNNVTTTANLTVGGETIVSGNILPTAHETYDLGSMSMAFKDLYLSGNSIYLSGTKLTSSAPGELSLTTNGQTTVLNAAGNAGVITSNVSASNFISNVTGNVVINAEGYLVDSSLYDTGVQPGKYGATNLVPTITIDEKGRVVEAATVEILGNTSVLGENTAGSLTSNAAALSPTTSITDSIAQLNLILGKLVPPSPPTFPAGQSISVSGLSSYRMTDFIQTDNTQTGGKSVPGGTLVNSIRRASTYSTSTVANVGPGDSGTVSAYLNGNDAGSVALTGTSNGTYSNLVISNNQDYHNVVSTVNSGFWYSFSASASGTVEPGWNEIYITDTAGTPTNIVDWYYDSATPGSPTWSNVAMSLTTNVSSYSSTIPHLTSSSVFTLSGNVNKLSGDTYPTTDTFITGSAGGAFSAPPSITYSSAGITTPLARNLYVTSGSAYITSQVSVSSGFGSSTTGPSYTAQNSYSTGSTAFTPGVTVLYKTGTSTQIEETSIPVNGVVGSGSGNGLRIINPGIGDNPVVSATTAFDSQSSTLETNDATVVAKVLKHDQTNYSTGYLPIGPDLSVGRSGDQYFTFKFTRTSVSKFDIKYTGTIAGMWVALPGSQLDSTSGLNGWLDMGVAYNGSGLPGQNSPGNGSNGCALGGAVSLNTPVTNASKTATFGTESSSNTTTNEILVRIKLTSGQTVTSISIETATH